MALAVHCEKEQGKERNLKAIIIYGFWGISKKGHQYLC